MKIKTVLICTLITLLGSCSSVTHREPVYKLGQSVRVNYGFFRTCSGWIEGFHAKKGLYYVDLACRDYMAKFRRGKGYQWIKEEHLEASFDTAIK